jgi:hypothetical protein
MPFPPETKLFGLAMIEARAKGVLDTLIIDEFGKLRILGPKGEYVWTSSDRFGGTDNFYETRKKLVELYNQNDSPAYRVYIPGRILVRDLDGDGTHELIINKNSGNATAFERAKTFEKGEVFNMVWDENIFLKNWQTREVTGYIADYQVRDADNDGRDELVVAIVNPGGKTSNIFFYKLP